MSSSSALYVGIDPTAGRQPFTYAAFDTDCQLTALSFGELEDVLSFLDKQPEALVAVNAPPRPNNGLVRKMLEKQNLSPGHLRGADMRLVENELRGRGIIISPTPSRPETCPNWAQMGFDLYRHLAELGFKPYPSEKASRQWLETNSHATFCALLGQIPLPKPTLEGRLQRQLALHEQGADIKDPMDFFEEITRHKLMRGVLPMESIYAAEELDALAAAYTAWLAADRPVAVIAVGNEHEGQIILPSAALKEHYV
jgi:hypothetical protein